jgi:hypothetical protein
MGGYVGWIITEGQTQTPQLFSFPKVVRVAVTACARCRTRVLDGMGQLTPGVSLSRSGASGELQLPDEHRHPFTSSNLLAIGWNHEIAVCGGGCGYVS